MPLCRSGRVPLQVGDNLADDAAVHVTDCVHGPFSFGRGLHRLMQPCPSARPGVARGRAPAGEGDHPPEGPRLRVCTSAARKTGETPAGGGPAPDVALAAPFTTARHRRGRPNELGDCRTGKAPVAVGTAGGLAASALRTTKNRSQQRRAFPKSRNYSASMIARALTFPYLVCTSNETFWLTRSICIAAPRNSEVRKSILTADRRLE